MPGTCLEARGFGQAGHGGHGRHGQAAFLLGGGGHHGQVGHGGHGGQETQFGVEACEGEDETDFVFESSHSSCLSCSSRTSVRFVKWSIVMDGWRISGTMCIDEYLRMHFKRGNCNVVIDENFSSPLKTQNVPHLSVTSGDTVSRLFSFKMSNRPKINRECICSRRHCSDTEIENVYLV